MAGTDDSKLDIRSQFSLAAKTVCAPRKTEVSANGNTSGNTTNGNTKSSTQVETLVRPPVVSPVSCGLKPGRKRPFRLMGRYSKEERDSVIARADEACLSVNEFIRVSTLDTSHIPPLNPELRKRFVQVYRELCKQGKDLERIAEQMETNIMSPNEQNTMLGMIGWAHMDTLRSVREALTWGLEMPEG